MGKHGYHRAGVYFRDINLAKEISTNWSLAPISKWIWSNLFAAHYITLLNIFNLKYLPSAYLVQFTNP